MICKSKIIMFIMAAALAFMTPLAYADTSNGGNGGTVYEWQHSPGFGDRHGKHHYRHHRHYHGHNRHHHWHHRHHHRHHRHHKQRQD